MAALARFAVGAAAAGHRGWCLPVLVAGWRGPSRSSATGDSRRSRFPAERRRPCARLRAEAAAPGTSTARSCSPVAQGPIFRISAGGGEPKPVTTLDNSRQETQHRWPSFLPDGRHFLYLARGPQQARNAVFVGSLDGSEVQQLVSADSPAVYAPPGYLLYVREGTLMAQLFDAAKRRSRATPRPWPSRSHRSERPPAGRFPFPPAGCSPTERAPTSRKASSPGSTARVASSGRWVSPPTTRTPRSRPTASVSPLAGATRRP